MDSGRHVLGSPGSGHRRTRGAPSYLNYFPGIVGGYCSSMTSSSSSSFSAFERLRIESRAPGSVPRTHPPSSFPAAFSLFSKATLCACCFDTEAFFHSSETLGPGKGRGKRE